MFDAVLTDDFAYSIPGALVMVLALFNLAKAMRRRSWPETIGVIQRNEVQQVTAGEFSLLRLDPVSNAGSTLGTEKEKVLGLSYVYAVSGFKYVGNKLYSAPIFKARQRIAGLFPGDKVKVFYNPSNPSSAFLAHSFAWPSLVAMAVGLTLAIMPIIFPMISVFL